MDPNPCLYMSFRNYTAGQDESKRSCPINSSFILFSRLPRAFLSLREEDTGDSKRALGEFHVLERNQGLFPVHISLSTLQASVFFFFLLVTMKTLTGFISREPTT